MADIDSSGPLPGLGPVLAGQVRYQVTLLLRTPRALLAGLILPGVLLALELGRVQHAGGQTTSGTRLAEVVGGLAVFGMLTITYLTHANGLVAAREDGVLRRWRATPLPSWGYFAGRITATVLLADAAALILVLVGIAMGGLRVSGGSVGMLLAATTLGGLAASAAGTAITPVVTSSQGANPMLTLTYIPLVIFSGGFGNLSSLPHWLTTLMSYLPAEPVVSAASDALRNAGGLTVRDAAVLCAWACGCLVLSMLFFRWEPTRQRRHPDRKIAGVPAR